MKKKHNFTIPAIIVLFIAGLAIYLYPYVSDKWNQYVNSRLVQNYQEKISDEDDDENNKKKTIAADEYNREIANRGGCVVNAYENRQSDEYDSLLSQNGTGMMGYIEIPKIKVSLPIYHYSSDDVLDRGVGHIHGSSLPVGGNNTHTVLTGHRGLPTSRLFTDLDQIEKGDRFYIHVFGRDLAYEVYDIRTVLPDQTESLTIEEGQDLATLVTCTPYGVNTHRLLVTGRRCEYDLEEKQEEEAAGKAASVASKITPQNALVLGLFVFMAVLIVSMCIAKTKNKKGNVNVENSKENNFDAGGGNDTGSAGGSISS